MKLSKDQISRLSQHILKKILAEQVIVAKVSEAKLQEKIEQVILKNIQAEKKIEQKVDQLLETYRAQISAGQLNERELFVKIKKELAKKEKFPL